MNKQTVSIISTVTNAALGTAKVVLGMAVSSSALVAEGAHSVIDFVSSGITYLGIRVAQRKPTERHPYGWGNAEVIAGLIVTIFVGLAGVQIVREGITALFRGEHTASINLLSLAVMGVSVLSNEILARLKIKVGREQESLALIADGKHSRVDVFSSAAALLGIGLARFFPVADSVTALLVGLFIVYETIELGKEVGENLLDVADLEAEKQIKKICKREQVNLVDIKTRKIGSLTYAELEVQLPEEVKVGRANDLVIDLQRKLIEQIPSLEYVTVQIEGRGERARMFRGREDEAESLGRCAGDLEQIGPEKVGYRVILPYRDGEIYPDFGAPEYSVIDYKNGNEVQHEIVENPYFKIGRGHGVRFAQAVRADEVKTKEIGQNAVTALEDLNIKIRKI